MLFFRSWLRQLAHRLSLPTGLRSRRKAIRLFRKRAGARLQLEELESRITPSSVPVGPVTDVWTGVGNWATDLNNCSLGAASTPTQNVEIQSGTVTHSGGSDTVNAITVDSGATANITGGSSITAQAAAGPQITDDGLINVGDASTAGHLIVDAANEEVAHTVNNSGSIVLGASASNTFGENAGQTLQIDSGITVRGNSGTIGNAGGTFNNYGGILANGSNGALTLDHGAGGTNTTNGDITVNASDRLTISAGGGSGASWTNFGAINVNPGGILGLDSTGSADGWHNSPTSPGNPGGTITSTNATVNLGGNFTQGDFGTSFNPDAGSVVGIFGTLTGNLDLTGQSGLWFLEGGTLANGTLSGAAPVLTATSLSGTLSNYTLSSVIDLTNGSIVVTNGLTLNGVTLQVGDANNTNKAGQIQFNGTQTVSGTGSISFGVNPNDSLYMMPGSITTLGHGITIDGQSGLIFGSGDVINHGTILGAVSGGLISIQTANFTNSSDGIVEAANGDAVVVGFGPNGGNTGTVEAISGGNLKVTGGSNVGTFAGFGAVSISGGGILQVNDGNTNSWTNAGSITVAGSTVNLGGAFTQAGLTGGGANFTRDAASTVNLTGKLSGGLTLNDTLGSWNLGGGTLSGGTYSVAANSSAALVATHAEGKLDGVTLNNAIDLTNGSVTVDNGLTLNATLNLGNQTNSSKAGWITFLSSETVSGSSAIVFGADPNNSLYTGVSNTIHIGSGVTVRGDAGAIFGSGVFILDSGATLEADVSGDAIGITTDTFTNNGIIEAQNGATVDVNPTTLTNVTGGNTLTGGAWYVFDNSTINLHNAITTNAAAVNLVGPSAVFSNLSGLTTNQASIALLNGAGFTTTGDLSNTGTINVGPGELSVHGNYTQGAGAVLDVGIGGTTAGTGYGQVTATETATLAGTINIIELNGFTAAVPQSFQIMSFGLKSGDFATYNGLHPASGASFTPSFSSNARTLNTITTFAVTNTNDSGAGSLRQAILDADASTGPVSITFNIPTSDSRYNTTTHAFSIHLLSALPTITHAVNLDATGEWAVTGFSGIPDVELEGTGISVTANGLTIGVGGDGSTVRGLVIDRFTGSGVEVDANNNIIVGNYIGTDVTGTVFKGNAGDGIYILGASNNIIGGTTAADRNVISGNGGNNPLISDHAGVSISGAGASNNTVAGNYIGTNKTGFAVALGNSFYAGVDIFNGATNNTIGGVTAGARNVISGNAGAGVLIHDAATTGNVVEGNYVGLKFQGSGPLANGWGVIINGAAHDNIIGGTTAGARNVISANTNDGVQISGAGTTGNLVEGDYIGIDFAGLGGPFVHNGGFGVNVSGASGNTIGGTAPGAGNVISNNARDGVYIHDVSGPSGGAANNVVQGTYIGTNAAGMASLGNNGVGVHIVGSSGNTIGGSTMAARNIVSGNGGVGIQISDSLSTGNVIAGNYIGSDVTV